MAKSKRACYLCGNQYEYCDCNRQPTYMATFCSENCRDIFKSLSSYGVGAISEKDCKELLDCCDLSNKGSYKESIQNTIDKLYASVVKEPEVIEEPIVEEVVVTPEFEVAEPIISSVPEFDVERKGKKRNHKVVLEDI